MGEVYRAYDLILNQSVALKFLPQHFNEASLARFRNEVRIARQVSHPNVCRVYDIGVADGMHFLSMEYLDGEDLASLLRRIGRLPQDKAVEFTRKLCAGLHAAHERGVLHRDLKPGNIMIDGRGQLRITDFGLAAIAEEVALADIRSGTPAYMSPEQKAGKEVTTRSDIYSLGLVVYEMFTGKHRSGSSSSMSDIVKDVDPAIERVVNRCLEEDPRRRPVTALNVAMALPGGILLSIVANGILLYLTLWVFRRFGLLAVLAGQFTFVCQGLAPLVLTEWYGGWALAAHGIPVALAAYALWAIVTSQSQAAEA